jgi:Rrf2 family protein
MLHITTVRTSCRFAVAVHVLAVLAYKGGEAVSSRLLAGSVNTNPVVIRRLLLLLQAAGLIVTAKGAGAGSKLARDPKKINLGEVYSAVEQEDAFGVHTKPNRKCPVGACIQAALVDIFSSAEMAMKGELAKTSLADVIKTIDRRCLEGRK